MSDVTERSCYETIERLTEQITRLKEQQTVTETKAALWGMTAEDSNQYKQRHNQIKNLTKELSVFDG
jgi:hypothetical protein